MKLVETDGGPPADWVKHIDETIKRIIEICQEPSLDASWVAGEVMREIDPDKASVPAISEGAHAYVKDRAAALLRKMFEPEYSPEEALKHAEALRAWEDQGNREPPQS